MKCTFSCDRKAELVWLSSDGRKKQNTPNESFYSFIIVFLIIFYHFIGTRIFWNACKPSANCIYCEKFFSSIFAKKRYDTKKEKGADVFHCNRLEKQWTKSGRICSTARYAYKQASVLDS